MNKEIIEGNIRNSLTRALELIGGKVNLPVITTPLGDKPLQKISYGAPGTGKSHETNKVARQYTNTVRTTFHPDSDYSTFVGSYKPTTTEEYLYGLNGDKTVVFQDVHGNSIKTSKIEYKFIKQAFLKAYIKAWQKMCKVSAKTSTSTLFTGKIAYTITIIAIEGDSVLYGKEGVDSIVTVGKDAIEKCYNGEKSVDVVEEIAKRLREYGLPTFEEAWERLANDVNNSNSNNNNNNPDLKPIAIRVGDNNSKEDEIEPQFLVIEEINRGNCAQIFGDIFQLLDRKENYSEYPIEADEDIQKALLEENPADGLSFGKDGLQLPDAIVTELQKVFENNKDNVVEKICKGQVLVLPKNLYIWATMNTSDQSLFPIDSAFKRRWDWEYVPIVDAGENWVIDVEGKTYNWWTFLEQVNQIINKLTNSEDKKLGYFFAKAKGKVVDTNTLVNKVFFYLWNDVFKDYELSTIKTFPLIKDAKDNKDRPYAFGDFFNDKTGKIEAEVVKQFLDALMPKTTEETTETTDEQAEE